MKKLILLFLICGCGACDQPGDQVKGGNFNHVNQVTVDSCEYLYLYFSRDGQPVLVHKANCKNPIHNKHE